MNGGIIRVLNEEDVARYRSIRLRALQSNPEAFGSTYEQEAKFSIEQFAERLKPEEGKFVLKYNGGYASEDLMVLFL